MQPIHRASSHARTHKLTYIPFDCFSCLLCCSALLLCCPATLLSCDSDLRLFQACHTHISPRAAAPHRPREVAGGGVGIWVPNIRQKLALWLHKMKQKIPQPGGRTKRSKIDNALILPIKKQKQAPRVSPASLTP